MSKIAKNLRKAVDDSFNLDEPASGGPTVLPPGTDDLAAAQHSQQVAQGAAAPATGEQVPVGSEQVTTQVTPADQPATPQVSTPAVPPAGPDVPAGTVGVPTAPPLPGEVTLAPTAPPPAAVTTPPAAPDAAPAPTGPDVPAAGTTPPPAAPAAAPADAPASAPTVPADAPNGLDQPTGTVPASNQPVNYDNLPPRDPSQPGAQGQQGEATLEELRNEIAQLRQEMQRLFSFMGDISSQEAGTNLAKRANVQGQNVQLVKDLSEEEDDGQMMDELYDLFFAFMNAYQDIDEAEDESGSFDMTAYNQLCDDFAARLKAIGQQYEGDDAATSALAAKRLARVFVKAIAIKAGSRHSKEDQHRLDEAANQLYLAGANPPQGWGDGEGDPTGASSDASKAADVATLNATKAAEVAKLNAAKAAKEQELRDLEARLAQQKAELDTVQSDLDKAWSAPLPTFLDLAPGQQAPQESGELFFDKAASEV